MKGRWTMLLAATALASVLSLSGCGSDGSDGAAGADGADGVDGIAGAPGADGTDGIDATIDPVLQAKAESCNVCHGGSGDMHQAEYNKYLDSNLELAITDMTSVEGAAADTWDLTLTFSIDVDGQPLIDAAGTSPSVDSIGFYVAQRDDNGDWLTSGGGFYPALAAGNSESNGDGTYTLEQNLTYNASAFVGGAIIGKIATDELNIADVNTGARVHLYDNLAHDIFDIGNIGTWESAANVEACESCHGKPYNKHGNIAAVVPGSPDFLQCHACHVDDKNGGHEDWQYLVDDPYGYATDAAPTADYTYTRSFMNDVHMSHAMEFPYPQSMANCATCHEGKLETVLADANFTLETCKSCHPVTGVDAWPKTFDAAGDEILDSRGRSVPGIYYARNRAPALSYIWFTRGVTFHNEGQTCESCHMGQVADSVFSDLHTGYDARITDATDEVKYADKLTASIDSIDVTDSVVTVEFSVDDADMVPYIYLSFYGWDSKQMIVASHTRDANSLRYEAAPGDDNALFVFTPNALGATSYTAVMDLTTYMAESTNDIPTLIADGVIKTGAITIAPRYTTAAGVGVGLDAVIMNFDVADGTEVADYFTDGAATVDNAKCEACHDKLAVTFHGGSGRSTVEACRNCHVTTSGGSHLEMQSRSIDSYVHAVHSFQPFDIGDVDFTDPVEAMRYEHHAHATFPNFTITNCEACHTAGVYNVPDQAESLPGLLSSSDDVDGRALTVPEYVTGPASRACGACHRADLINENEFGALAAFNAHTQMGGTLVENDADDVVLYGIIDKIMAMFQ
jgi:OmcA/MtrC family decaheme c-type cytochrome